MGKTLVQVKKGKREFSKILAITASICLLWGCLYHIGMNLIPEEFSSEQIKFVLHSDDKIDRLSLCGFRVRSNTHAPLALDYIHDLRFSIRNEVRFKFSRYQNEISYQNENFIWIEKRNDLSGKEMLASVSSFLYHVNNP